jgi:PIN domain nuclease of toxin-antitoxin system
LIYLDTHIVVWLFAGLLDKFSHTVKAMLNENERVKEPASVIVADLSDRIGLEVCEKDFNAVVSQALTLTWTRDPFDRVIVANAKLSDNILISKDPSILENYAHARW